MIDKTNKTASNNDENIAMSDEQQTIQNITDQDYKYGFVTDIEMEEFPKGLDENIEIGRAHV